jgi:hypothetical protein
MSFSEQLRASKGNLSAREVAEAISPKLSVRTVEEWLADRRTPPEWTHDIILWRISQRASCARHDWKMTDEQISDARGVSRQAANKARQRYKK